MANAQNIETKSESIRTQFQSYVPPATATGGRMPRF